MIEKLKEILKIEGLRGKDLSEKLEITYGSYRSMTRKKARNIPKWVRGFVIGYELGKQSKNE